MQAQRPDCRQKAVRDDGTPLCHHDAPMYRFGTTWRCAVRVRERQRASYDYAKRSRWNERQIQVGDIYLGTVGFTASEREAMLNGTSERPRHP
jgi:hypothetical protein